MRRWRCLWLALLVWAAAAPPARAHADLVSSSPAEGERLAQPPAAILLVFDEELDAQGSQFQVYDAAGQLVPAVSGQVDLTDPEHARLVAESVPALPDGAYIVRWTALSADGDGAVTTGEFVFGVGSGDWPLSPAATAAPAPTLAAAMDAPPAAAPAERPDFAWASLGVAGGAACVLTLMAVALLRPRR
jgi:methionine-rich copper-binding protein CopC